jgi:hypothetical protein
MGHYGLAYSPVKTAAVMGIPRNPDTLPSSPGTAERQQKNRVKISGSTQTTPDAEYMVVGSPGAKPALSANVRERILANYAQSHGGGGHGGHGQSGGTAIMYPRRGGGGKTDGSLSDSNYSNYADLIAAKDREYGGPGEGVYSWASRHYSPYSSAGGAFRRFGGIVLCLKHAKFQTSSNFQF